MADRPIECSQCKKAIKIVYKEIVDDAVVCSDMCADCPLLNQRLHGKEQNTNGGAAVTAGEGLCCGHCHTSLEAIRMGNPLGCGECYNIFSEAIVLELIQADRIPSALRKNILGKKTQSLHIGKGPHPAPGPTPAAKLTSLHEALNDALKKENYEQAAWIRDQIKGLIGKSYETSI